MAVTQYIGSRYVPLFADPIEWSNAKEYEPLTIVTHEGNSYTAKQFVPVGIDITNGEFWVLTGNYNAQVEQYRRETAAAQQSADAAQQSADAAQTDIDKLDDLFRTLVFDTVADMKNSSDLKEGLICETLGFYSIGDGGASKYIIENNGTGNELDSFSIGSLYANMLYGDCINIRQLGALPDAGYNCTSVLLYAISAARNKRIYIPNGEWYFSETLFTGTDGFELYGNWSFDQYEKNNATIILPFNTNQAYIFKFGGTSNINETSVPWTSRCTNVYVHDLTFNSVYNLDGAISLHLALFNRFDNLTFVKVAGTSIEMMDSWENLFGTVIIRSCDDFTKPKINFRTVATVEGITVSPNISSNNFSLIHAESIAGTLMSAELRSYVYNCNFDTIIIEGATYSESYDSYITYSESDAVDANAVYYIEGYYNNCTFGNVNISLCQIRDYIYVKNGVKYYRSAIIHIPDSQNNNVGSQINMSFGIIDINAQNSDFVLLESENSNTQRGIITGKVMLEGISETKNIYQLTNGIVPMFEVIHENKTNSLPIYDMFALSGNINACTYSVDGETYITCGRNNNTAMGHWIINKQGTIGMLVYNSDDSSTHYINLNINGTNHAVAVPSGINYVTYDATSETVPMNVAINSGTGLETKLIGLYV